MPGWKREARGVDQSLGLGLGGPWIPCLVSNDRRLTASLQRLEESQQILNLLLTIPV